MTFRVLIQGFGAMGQECLKALENRSDAEVTAILDSNPDLVGRVLGDVLKSSRWANIEIRHPESADWDRLDADVAIHATTAFASEAAPQISRLLEAGLDVATICQELVYPIDDRLPVADALHKEAQSHGRSVVAGGVNPGWILDILVVAASLGCVDITAVTASRVVDFSPYGTDEMAHIGAGLDMDSFNQGADNGKIGHIGLRESTALVAAALGLDVTTWTETKQPIIAEKRHSTKFVTVEPGGARGFVQRVQGAAGARTVIDFEMRGLLDVGADDPPLGDRITIKATPDIDLTVHGDDTSRGGPATAGVVTNLLGPVQAAAPGLHTVLSLPLIRSRTKLGVAD